MTIGPYTLICRSSTEDDDPNYSSQWAMLDVYKGGKQIDTMTPVRRFYKASQQTSTMPDIRSTLNEDLYLVFEGLNQDNGHPILKAHLNALVMWIWMGVWIMLDWNGSGADSERASAGARSRPRPPGDRPHGSRGDRRLMSDLLECGTARSRVPHFCALCEKWATGAAKLPGRPAVRSSSSYCSAPAIPPPASTKSATK